VKTDLPKEEREVKIPEHIRELVRDERVRSEAEKTLDGTFGESVREAIFVSRVTSHPDVGKRWYPDVLERALAGKA
jgi:hypothetical protein